MWAYVDCRTSIDRYFSVLVRSICTRTCWITFYNTQQRGGCQSLSFTTLHNCVASHRRELANWEKTEASQWSDILSGVPQGSVLGFILLVLYINDIDDTVNNKILKSADDTKIYNKVDSVEGIIYERMRADLRNLVVWSKKWQTFDVEKCKVMHLGYNNSKVNY